MIRLFFEPDDIRQFGVVDTGNVVTSGEVGLTEPIRSSIAATALFIAFSTGNRGAASATGPSAIQMLPNDKLNPVFEAAVQATEEAIINAMVGAETMTGIDGHKVFALPHDGLRDALKKYNRFVPAP